jgi:hypothetical protein
MKTIFRKIVRVVIYILLLSIALMGVMFPPPRRLEQDYDNEIKTELVEGTENEMAEEKN